MRSLVLFGVLVGFTGCGMEGTTPGADMGGGNDAGGDLARPVDLASSADHVPIPDLTTPPDLTQPAPPDLAQPDLVPGPRRVFIAPVHDGNLGGEAGANKWCGTAASDANLAGTYVAVLGYQGKNPVDFIKLGQGRPIVDVKGNAVATDATFWTAMHDGPIHLSADGNFDIEKSVWTSFDTTGKTFGGPCGNWGAGGTTAPVGNIEAADSKWSGANVRDCNLLAHLYCIEQ